MFGKKMLHNYAKNGYRIPVGPELYCLVIFPPKPGTGRISRKIQGMRGCKNGDWSVEVDVIFDQSDCRRVLDDFGRGHTWINNGREGSVDNVRKLAKCRSIFKLVSDSTVRLGFGTKTFQICQQFKGKMDGSCGGLNLAKTDFGSQLLGKIKQDCGRGRVKK